MGSSILKLLECGGCGAPLEPKLIKNGLCKCNHCTSNNIMPKDDQSEEVIRFLHDGDLALKKSDFIGAYEAYQSAAEIDPSEAMAYFGMALADQKVKYIRDLRIGGSGEEYYYQPICFKVMGKRFDANKNYLLAIKHAISKEQAKEFKSKAKAIDEIRQKFCDFEKTVPKYDTFICVKVTEIGDKNKKTGDSEWADKLYEKIKSTGLNPFYSERDVGSRVGVDYEALILYALYCSKSMIIVCSDESYLKTPWVQNEYTRYYSMISAGKKSSDSIAIAFNGEIIEELPGISGKRQGVDLAKKGATEKLINFVKRFISIDKEISEEIINAPDIEYVEPNLEYSYENGMTIYEKALYMESNPDAARALFKSAFSMFLETKDSDVRSWFGIALCSHYGYGVDKNEEKAYDIFAEIYEKIHRLAESGDGEAMLIMYECSNNGYFVSEDHKKAESWLMRAVEIGNPRALYIRSQKCDKMALQYLNRAYDKGYHLAYFDKGNLSYFGYMTDPDGNKSDVIYDIEEDNARRFYQEGSHVDPRCKQRRDEMRHLDNGFRIFLGRLESYRKKDSGAAVTVPDGVVSISDGAFSDTHIRDLILPQSVKEISDGAFGNSRVPKLVTSNPALKAVEKNLRKSEKKTRMASKMHKRMASLGQATGSPVTWFLLPPILIALLLVIADLTGIFEFKYATGVSLVLYSISVSMIFFGTFAVMRGEHDVWRYLVSAPLLAAFCAGIFFGGYLPDTVSFVTSTLSLAVAIIITISISFTFPEDAFLHPMTWTLFIFVMTAAFISSATTSGVVGLYLPNPLYTVFYLAAALATLISVFIAIRTHKNVRRYVLGLSLFEVFACLAFFGGEIPGNILLAVSSFAAVAAVLAVLYIVSDYPEDVFRHPLTWTLLLPAFSIVFDLFAESVGLLRFNIPDTMMLLLYVICTVTVAMNMIVALIKKRDTWRYFVGLPLLLIFGNAVFYAGHAPIAVNAALSIVSLAVTILGIMLSFSSDLEEAFRTSLTWVVFVPVMTVISLIILHVTNLVNYNFPNFYIGILYTVSALMLIVCLFIAYAKKRDIWCYLLGLPIFIAFVAEIFLGGYFSPIATVISTVTSVALALTVGVLVASREPSASFSHAMLWTSFLTFEFAVFLLSCRITNLLSFGIPNAFIVGFIALFALLILIALFIAMARGENKWRYIIGLPIMLIYVASIFFIGYLPEFLHAPIVVMFAAITFVAIISIACPYPSEVFYASSTWALFIPLISAMFLFVSETTDMISFRFPDTSAIVFYTICALAIIIKLITVIRSGKELWKQFIVLPLLMLLIGGIFFGGYLKTAVYVAFAMAAFAVSYVIIVYQSPKKLFSRPDMFALFVLVMIGGYLAIGTLTGLISFKFQNPILILLYALGILAMAIILVVVFANEKPAWQGCLAFVFILLFGAAILFGGYLSPLWYVVLTILSLVITFMMVILIACEEPLDVIESPLTWTFFAAGMLSVFFVVAKFTGLFDFSIPHTFVLVIYAVSALLTIVSMVSITLDYYGITLKYILLLVMLLVFASMILIGGHVSGLLLGIITAISLSAALIATIAVFGYDTMETLTRPLTWSLTVMISAVVIVATCVFSGEFTLSVATTVMLIVYSALALVCITTYVLDIGSWHSMISVAGIIISGACICFGGTFPWWGSLIAGIVISSLPIAWHFTQRRI